MTNKPTIAILGGTGHEGTGLALRWASNGYEVIIGSRKEEKALKVTAELNEILGEDLITGMENEKAAQKADINVLTVVASAHEVAIKGLKDALQGKILVDATARIQFPNPLPPTPPSAARLSVTIDGACASQGVVVRAAPEICLRRQGRGVTGRWNRTVRGQGRRGPGESDRVDRA